MKITHIISGLGVGGTENVLLDIARRHASMGHAVNVISLTAAGPVADKLKVAGVTVNSLHMQRGSFDLGALFILASWLRQTKPDIVNTWMYHANLLGGVVARSSTTAPLVWGIHHVLDREGDKYLRRNTALIAGLGALLSGILPGRIICCARSALTSHIQRGYAARRMLLIRNGVDVEQYQPLPAVGRQLRRELDIPATVPVVGMFARYHPVKDHRTFMQAAAILSRRLPTAHFVLAGSGVDSANIELSGLIDSSFERNVHLLGLRRDIPSLFNVLTLATLSSRMEAFPNVLCEAMSCGVPCVATDAGDTSHIIGDTGRIVPIGDAHALSTAWFEILNMSPAGRLAMGWRARQRALSEFDLAKTAQRYLDLYMQMRTGNGNI